MCEGEGVTLCSSRKGEAIRRKASLSCGVHRCDWPTANLSPVHLSIDWRQVHGRLSVVLVLQDRTAAWSGPSAAFPSWPQGPFFSLLITAMTSTSPTYDRHG